MPRNRSAQVTTSIHDSTPDITSRAAAIAASLRRKPVEALQREYRAVFRRPTRLQDRGQLIQKISEERARQEHAAGPAADAPCPQRPRGRFSGMSVAELQALYLEKVGRPTGSTDAGYLMWKIREAEKGRITLGAIPTSARAQHGPSKPVPWTIPAEFLAELDEVRARRGFSSRTALITAGVALLLSRIGERNVADRFEGLLTNPADRV